MPAAVKPLKTRHRTSQYSTRTRVKRLHERLELETDPRTRATILAQLAAFERPPRGTYD